MSHIVSLVRGLTSESHSLSSARRQNGDQRSAVTLFTDQFLNLIDAFRPLPRFSSGPKTRAAENAQEVAELDAEGWFLYGGRNRNLQGGAGRARPGETGACQEMGRRGGVSSRLPSSKKGPCAGPPLGLCCSKCSRCQCVLISAVRVCLLRFCGEVRGGCERCRVPLWPRVSDWPTCLGKWAAQPIRGLWWISCRDSVCEDFNAVQFRYVQMTFCPGPSTSWKRWKTWSPPCGHAFAIGPRTEKDVCRPGPPWWVLGGPWLDDVSAGCS